MSTGEAQDPCKYALALMDVVFTDEEMLNYHVAGWVTFALATNIPCFRNICNSCGRVCVFLSYLRNYTKDLVHALACIRTCDLH